MSLIWQVPDGIQKDTTIVQNLLGARINKHAQHNNEYTQKVPEKATEIQ